MEHLPLKVTIECDSKTVCVFDGTAIELNVRVTNVSPGPFELPLTFLKQRGAYISVTDPQSGRTHPLQVGYPDFDLLERWETLSPTHSFTLPAVIEEAMLRKFFTAETDIVVAAANISTDVRMPNGRVTNIAGNEVFQIVRAKRPLPTMAP